MVTTFAMKIRNDRNGKKLLQMIRELDRSKLREIALQFVGDLDDGTMIDEYLQVYDKIPTGDMTVYVTGSWVNQDASGNGVERTVKRAIRAAVCAMIINARAGYQDLTVIIH